MLPTKIQFDGVTLDVTDRECLPWLWASQIGMALGYKNAVADIANLYDRNADEFTDEMTALLDLPTAGGIQKVRVFSPRGCYLIAMFARTSKAKAFRKWVLDVLEKATEPPSFPVGEPQGQLRTGLGRGSTPRFPELTKAFRKHAVRLGIGECGLRRRVAREFGRRSVATATPETADRMVKFMAGLSPKPSRISLEAEISVAALRLGISTSAVQARMRRRYSKFRLYDMTDAERCDAREWLDALGTDHEHNRPHGAVATFSGDERPKPALTSAANSVSLYGMVRLELFIPLDKAQRILAIAGE